MSHPRTVAVFGSSEPTPDTPLYETARIVGCRLAEAGFAVITGGYGGVMEAANRGAHEAGGHSVGVACKIFSSRSPNRYLNQTVATDDLHERTRVLIDRADGFVILEGKAGTLAELAFLWALQRAGCLGAAPVVLLGGNWSALLPTLERLGILDAELLKATRISDSPERVLQILQDDLGSQE